MVQMSNAPQQEQARPMRQRLQSWRPRSMARPRADDERRTLSRRSKVIGGWLVALLLVLGIAVGVAVLGGDGAGAPTGAVPSGSGAASDLAPIAFGTSIDESTGQVAETSRTDRFTAGDTFAYSVAPAGSVPDEIYVEVRRVSGESHEIAQEPVDAQVLPDPRAIAFSVPTDDLLAVFGAGEYIMLIYTEPTGEPIAEGAFELVSADVAPSASP